MPYVLVAYVDDLDSYCVNVDILTVKREDSQNRMAFLKQTISKFVKDYTQNLSHASTSLTDEHRGFKHQAITFVG